MLPSSIFGGVFPFVIRFIFLADCIMALISEEVN